MRSTKKNDIGFSQGAEKKPAQVNIETFISAVESGIVSLLVSQNKLYVSMHTLAVENSPRPGGKIYAAREIQN